MPFASYLPDTDMQSFLYIKLPRITWMEHIAGEMQRAFMRKYIHPEEGLVIYCVPATMGLENYFRIMR